MRLWRVVLPPTLFVAGVGALLVLQTFNHGTQPWGAIVAGSLGLLYGLSTRRDR